MAQFKNHIAISGNLVGDMRIVKTQAKLKDGSPFLIAEGTLALNGVGENATPTFVQVQVTGYNAKNLIDNGKHLKGQNFGVFGTLVQEKFIDKNHVQQYKTKVVADDIMFGKSYFANMNQVTLYGHAAADPTFKQKGDVQHARVAIGNTIYDSRKKEQVTSYFNIVAFGQRAGVLAKYVQKGEGVIVTGRLHSSSYEKSQPDGSVVKQYNLDVIANEIIFAQRKEKDQVAVANNNEVTHEETTAPAYNPAYQRQVEVDNSETTTSPLSGTPYNFVEEDLPF